MPRPIPPPRPKADRSGWFYVHYYDHEAGRPRREALGTKSPAEAEARFQVWLKQESPASVVGATVNDVLDLYVNNVVEKEVVNKQTILSQLIHVRAGLGDLVAEEVKRKDVEAYIEKMLTRYKPGTVRNQVAYLHTAYKYAHKRDLISCPPPVYDLPESSEPRERWLTLREIDTLIKAASDYRHTTGSKRLLPAEILIHLALRTAARSNAIHDLTWDRVNFDTGIIDYRSPEWLALPKKRRSKRRAQVPISDKLFPILDRAYAERTDDLVIGGWRKTDYDFLQIIEFSELTGFSGPHTLRHTWATHASMNGIQMTEIARVMAITTDMAEAVYAKHAPDYLRKAVNF